MSAGQHKGRHMDIKEFEKQMPPKAKRSRLEPFHSQIFELKEKGYANWQICKYLADNGIKISSEGVRKFIKSRAAQPLPTAEKKDVVQPQVISSSTTNKPAQAGTVETGPGEPERDSSSGIPVKKELEKKASRYFKDQLGNENVDSLLNKPKD